MILWLIFAAITLATLGLLLFPLLCGQKETPQRADYDIAIYRDQLNEVDKDAERGLLALEQAAAARAEIHRRMLAAEDVGTLRFKSGSSFQSKFTLALIIVIGLPFAACLMYSFLGSPELSGKPYVGREHDPDFIMAAEAERLAARLEKHPDAEGYQYLAGAYFMLRRYDEAAEAYRKIIDINGGDADVWSRLGEVIALSQDGMVVPEARTAFSKALRLDPHEPRARFYLGLAEMQKGNPRRAIAIWRDLEKDSKPDAPWMGVLKEHIARVSKEGGFSPESVPPAAPPIQ